MYGLSATRSGVGTAIVLAMLLACSEPQGPEEVFEVDATVRFIDVSGGCWSLETDEGERFVPLSIPPEYLHDGIAVRARLERLPEFGSLCMVGEVVQLHSLELRSVSWRRLTGDSG